jgi:hypothetical protein
VWVNLHGPFEGDGFASLFVDLRKSTKGGLSVGRHILPGTCKSRPVCRGLDNAGGFPSPVGSMRTGISRGKRQFARVSIGSSVHWQLAQTSVLGVDFEWA